MENLKRKYTRLDQCCLSIDQMLRAIKGRAQSKRPNPALGDSDLPLSAAEKKHIAGLMRVNHSGEVCAQALYHGQALVSKNSALQQHLQEAALEEGDHLAWCKMRLSELEDKTSLLNPAFYLGSFAIGVTAGLVGDKWSLGFVAETEKQVVEHLEKHIALLPENDTRSLKILKQMRTDEAEHREEAIKAGAAELPWFIKKLMTFTSKIMVKTAYWV